MIFMNVARFGLTRLSSRDSLRQAGYGVSRYVRVRSGKSGFDMAGMASPAPLSCVATGHEYGTVNFN